MASTLEAGLVRLREGDPRAEALLGPRSAEVLRLLHIYIEEIERFNPAYGLVGARNREELTVKHILDSLAPLGIISGLIRAGSPAADVGSGAGLPGIPLAIALPDADFTLIERMGRRANFLRNTLAVLGLPNARVEEADMERTPGSRFDLAVFRAFRPLEPPLLRALFRLLRPGGVLAAYKGRRAAIMEELAGVEDLEIVPCPVPFLAEERHLLCLRDTLV